MKYLLLLILLFVNVAGAQVIQSKTISKSYVRGYDDLTHISVDSIFFSQSLGYLSFTAIPIVADKTGGQTAWGAGDSLIVWAKPLDVATLSLGGQSYGPNWASPDSVVLVRISLNGKTSAAVLKKVGPIQIPVSRGLYLYTVYRDAATGQDSSHFGYIVNIN